MSLISVPALVDNYLWLLHNDKHALVMNPGDAKPVIAVRFLLNPDLKLILVTRHHARGRLRIPSKKWVVLSHGIAARCTRPAISADLRRPFTCESDNRGMATAPQHHYPRLCSPHPIERMNSNRPIKNHLK